MKKVLSVLFLICSLAVSAAFAGGPPLSVQSSTKATEWGFDFVEEFDGLQDWVINCPPSTPCRNRYYEAFPTWMPKLANGNPSAINYFSQWEVGDAAAPAISAETDSGRKVWRGAKSMTIDLSGPMGASRVGFTFCDVTAIDAANCGYKSWSVFFMVWIPRNHHPTYCVTDCGGNGINTGEYTEGQPYTYYGYYKFGHLSMECNGITCPYSNTYGEHVTVVGQKRYSGSPTGMLIHNSNDGDSSTVYGTQGAILDNLYGDWFGVEYKITNNPTDTAYTMDVWVYDNQGNASHNMRGATFNIPADATAAGGRWDHIVFGGNVSLHFGDSMQSHYYIDDVIVDDGSKGQIGPRYFALIANDLPTPLAPPNNISNWSREAL